jgi:hypothetical protein
VIERRRRDGARSASDVPGLRLATRGNQLSSKGGHMLAALNMGIIGTIIVIALIVAVVLFLMRRA